MEYSERGGEVRSDVGRVVGLERVRGFSSVVFLRIGYRVGFWFWSSW